MPGTFFGIDTALRGLEAQQTAIDVTSHNIANASTPGYSRQTVDLQTTEPFYAPSLQPAGAGQIGTGVQVASIDRAHDAFIQQQIVYQNGVQSQQQTLSDTLSQVSQIFNEPTSQGFGNLLSSYFTSWQQLANNPSDNGARAAVAAQGAALAAGFNSAANSLSSMQQDQNNQIGSYVQNINTLTQQIADLNKQIVAVGAVGEQPNDLQDRRDTLLNQLSQLADVQYSVATNGVMNVSLVSGGALVQGVTSNKLVTIPDATRPQFSDVALQGQTTPLTISGGQLGGALTARDVTIAGRISALDSLANNVITAVNGYQSSGYGSNGATGIPFFTGTSAASMAVNPQIQANVANIAASAAPNSPGDGSQALLIAKLQENPAPGQTTTLQAQYQGIISQLGVEAQQAQTGLQTGQLVLQNLTAQQASVSSVSTNQEASYLIQYQHAYEACARVISIIDQTISDMINKLGG